MWQKRLIGFLVLVSGIIAPIAGFAEQSQDVGDYVIHYNALTTDTLQPVIAQRYGLRRSPNRVLLNVAVLRKVLGTTGQPVHARVTAHASNLNSQLRNIFMREVGERGAIYYLGDLTVNNGETLNFTINISTGPQSPTHTINFQQQFFTN